MTNLLKIIQIAQNHSQLYARAAMEEQLVGNRAIVSAIKGLINLLLIHMFYAGLVAQTEIPNI